MRIQQVNKTNCRQYIEEIYHRQANSFADIDRKVAEIIAQVQQEGDSALFSYTELFDGVKLSALKVSKTEIEEAVAQTEPEFLAVLQEAYQNIKSFHEKQKQKTWLDCEQEGIILGQKMTAIERVGVYVPGGKAAYPSSVLMNVIPAQVAGVESIALVSPPNKEGKMNPHILAACFVCGITEIYKIGGAQAIAALAYGTETIPAVYKITGPGNIFVARAKAKVFGKVAIDMIAGPSEIAIVADDTANPQYVAADLLSQAEHDELASAVLITNSMRLAETVAEETHRQMQKLSRIDIMGKSLANYGMIFVVENLEEAVAVANEFASEHLELMVANPFAYLPKVRNAGAIFLGAHAPEPLGDYFAGPNHTLPTNGTAKFSSPLNVDDFMKKTSILYYEREALEKVSEQIIAFAEKEGLTAHANAIAVRFRKE